MKRYTYAAALMLFFFLMLFFPASAFEGASRGLVLWFQTILPTLLPFIIITNLLIHTNVMFYVAKLFSPLFSKVFHITPPSSFAVLSGFLCGYPMGAKVISDLIRTQRISRREGAYLLSFCNNTSPVFVMNYIVIRSFARRELLLPSLAILFFTPVILSFFFRRYYLRKGEFSVPDSSGHQKGLRFGFDIVDDCIMNGFEIITKVGGYIILFSVLLSLFTIPGISSGIWQRLFLPSLELTNGIALLSEGTIRFEAEFVLILSMTAFGGCCSVAQTNCMIQDSGLNIIPYIIEKLITALVTSLLACLYLFLV